MEAEEGTEALWGIGVQEPGPAGDQGPAHSLSSLSLRTCIYSGALSQCTPIPLLGSSPGMTPHGTHPSLSLMSSFRELGCENGGWVF